MRSYSAIEFCEVLKNFDLLPEKDYGIRCPCDYWGNNELK